MKAILDIERVYLSVPYVEKDEAKKHGARWDPVVERWWVARRDLAAHAALFRWMTDSPMLAAKVKHAHDFVGIDSSRAAIEYRRHGPRWSPRKDFSLPECCCGSAPWEDCQHTAGTAL